jgi:hypothetical protein
MLKFILFLVFNLLCIFSLSAVGLFFLLFRTSLVYIFLVFVLSLWSLCECDAISYVLILFRFGSVVLVLIREAVFCSSCFPCFCCFYVIFHLWKY